MGSSLAENTRPPRHISKHLGKAPTTGMERRDWEKNGGLVLHTTSIMQGTSALYTGRAVWPRA
jgi:hypothetical protein